jgi:hypothetical protein
LRLRDAVSRWIEVLLAFFLSFLALRRLASLFRLGWDNRSEHAREWNKFWRGFLIVLPALLLAILFSSLFAAGNAIFRQWSGSALSGVFQWLSDVDLAPGRVLLWLVVFTLFLSLLHPMVTGLGEWITRWSLPAWRRRDENMGRWQSAIILAVVNALFFFVNTIDVVYLWSSAALPAGVNPSAYLHEGVQGLIFAVLLSALVLLLLFQQQLARGSRMLKWLSTAWVLQNMVVLAGVFLRLKLYVDELQLTLLRLGVGLFLLLVIIGFALLTIYFWQSRSLSWLVQRNILATFLLFFTVQFLDLNRFIAEYNVDRWISKKERYPDVKYLSRLEPGSWPALQRLAERAGDPGSITAAGYLMECGPNAEEYLSKATWRNWERNRYRRSLELQAYLRGPRLRH